MPVIAPSQWLEPLHHKGRRSGVTGQSQSRNPPLNSRLGPPMAKPRRARNGPFGGRQATDFGHPDAQMSPGAPDRAALRRAFERASTKKPYGSVRPAGDSGVCALPRGPYLDRMLASQVTPQNLRDLVGRFYGRARRDELIGPVFNAAIEDWDHHLDHIATFWTASLLGVGRFEGRPMAKHLRQPITPPMFDRWLALWGEATSEIYEPDIARGLQARAARIAESFKLGLFYRPELDAPKDQPAGA